MNKNHLYLLILGLNSLCLFTSSQEIQCIVCDESQNPDCRYLNNHHQPVVCQPGPVDATGCYRYESNNNVIRGCVSSLVGTPRLQDCQAGVICKICHTSSCNSKVDFQRCYSCNSGLDYDCLRVQNDTRPVTVCHDYMDSCVNIIQEHTRLTIRGCTLEIDAMHTAMDHLRLTCPANLCNTNIFPVWRATCHQCDSGEECNRNGTETTQYLMPCKIFWQDDQCYSVLRDRQAVRGCIKDADANVAFCQNSETCEICTESGCNFRPASRPGSLQCIRCQNLAHCTWGFPTSTVFLTSCQGDVWMGEVESCQTGLGPNNNVMRGCSHHHASDYSCPENYSCLKCHDSLCNNVAITRQRCIRCRSNASGQESCAEEAQGLQTSECSGDQQSFYERGCYTMRKPNGIVIRGCRRDLSHEDFYSTCYEHDNPICITCLGQDCNIGPAPANANILHPLYTLLLFLVTALKFL